jgi:hypothetical protein
MVDSMSMILAYHTKILSKARFYAISGNKETTVDQEN